MDWVGSSAIDVLCLSFAAAGGVDRNHSWGARAVSTADAGLALGSGRRVAGGGLLLSGGFVQYGLDAGGGGGGLVA